MTGHAPHVTLTHDGRVNIRDRFGVVIELRPDVWEDAGDRIRAGGLPRHAVIAGGACCWQGVPPRTGNVPVTLRFPREEWAAFVRQVQAGGFDLDRLDEADVIHEVSR